METNDRAGVLGALLARGRGLPRLGPGADYLAYDVERASWQRRKRSACTTRKGVAFLKRW